MFCRWFFSSKCFRVGVVWVVECSNGSFLVPSVFCLLSFGWVLAVFSQACLASGVLYPHHSWHHRSSPYIPLFNPRFVFFCFHHSLYHQGATTCEWWVLAYWPRCRATIIRHMSWPRMATITHHYDQPSSTNHCWLSLTINYPLLTISNFHLLPTDHPWIVIDDHDPLGFKFWNVLDGLPFRLGSAAKKPLRSAAVAPWGLFRRCWCRRNLNSWIGQCMVESAHKLVRDCSLVVWDLEHRLI